MNKAIIVGNLGDDPKSNVTGSGTAVTNFSVATSESWADSNGERQERTEWHRVVAWRKLAEIAGSYLRKGSKVYIEGKLQTRAWEDSNGEKRYTTEIVADELRMLDGRDEAPTVSVYTPPQQAGDDLPF